VDPQTDEDSKPREEGSTRGPVFNLRDAKLSPPIPDESTVETLFFAFGDDFFRPLHAAYADGMANDVVAYTWKA
jgi:hypothetical protein